MEIRTIPVLKNRTNEDKEEYGKEHCQPYPSDPFLVVAYKQCLTITDSRLASCKGIGCQCRSNGKEQKTFNKINNT